MVSMSWDSHDINQGTIPPEWKEANVVPIFKKGDKSRASNYRPVSLTVVTCKMLEHIKSLITTVIKQAGQEIVTRSFINHNNYLYGLSIFSMEKSLN
jgi:hypothetical protein